jgi:hypothetical protein
MKNNKKREIDLSSEAAEDLKGLLLTACSNLQRLLSLSDTYLGEHPNWKQATKQSVSIYAPSITSIRLVENSKLFQTQFKLSDTQMQVANRSALLIIWGLSHYLEWAGFEISNPTSFTEISSKLGGARQPAMILAITMARTKLYGAVSEQDLFSLKVPEHLAKYYKKSFGLGVTLGYIIDCAYLEGVIAAKKVLENEEKT